MHAVIVARGLGPAPELLWTAATCQILLFWCSRGAIDTIVDHVYAQVMESSMFIPGSQLENAL